MTHRAEGILLCLFLSMVLGVLYLLQNHLGVWSGLVIGVLLFHLVISWDVRWYRGSDRKWYRSW